MRNFMVSSKDQGNVPESQSRSPRKGIVMRKMFFKPRKPPVAKGLQPDLKPCVKAWDARQAPVIFGYHDKERSGLSPQQISPYCGV